MLLCGGRHGWTWAGCLLSLCKFAKLYSPLSDKTQLPEVPSSHTREPYCLFHNFSHNSPKVEISNLHLHPGLGRPELEWFRLNHFGGRRSLPDAPDLNWCVNCSKISQAAQRAVPKILHRAGSLRVKSLLLDYGALWETGPIPATPAATCPTSEHSSRRTKPSVGFTHRHFL